MKIAIIGHAHFPIKEPFVGGLETHTALLANQLVDDGHDVTLYSKFGSQTKARNIPIFIGDSKDGESILLRSGYLFAMADIASKGYDLILNNSLSDLPLILHSRFMPHMITVFHTPPLHEMVASLKRKKPANRTYIAVSNVTSKQWLLATNVSSTVVSNGIDTSLWEPTVTKQEQQSAIWFGRITPEKGTHVAIQACKQLGLPLKIVGNVYDKEYFKTKIEPELDSDLITYVGHKNQYQLTALIGQSSVSLVTPLWSEPFGYVVVESLACGTPVAGLPNGALPSLVIQHVGSLADNNEVNAFASAISSALTKDRQRCIDYVNQNFTNKTMVDSYLKLHEDYTFMQAGLWQAYP